jgi:hypothetical protein
MPPDPSTLVLRICRGLGAAAWFCVIASTAFPVPPGTTAPPTKKSVLTAKPQKPSLTTPSNPVRAEVPAIPLVREDGPLSRSDVIQLAIQAHPDFWRFRGEVAYFLEAEAAAYDWQDPELRIGFDHEFEADLEAPYVERRSGMTSEAGFFDTTSSTGFFDNDGSGDPTGITQGRNSQRQRTSQLRQIRTQEEIRVTPGKYHDILETTTYELERRREHTKENRKGSDNSRRNETTDEFSRRRVLSRTREIRTHPNSVYGDDAFVITARLFIPNPWDMKARAARARAEADLSSKRLGNEVRDLVYDVGRRYDELQFRYAWHQANLRLSELHQRNLKAIEKEAADMAALPPAARIQSLDPMDVARARLEIGKATEEVFDSGRELGIAKQDLCLLCGLADPSRIVLTNSLRLRKISEEQLNVADLTEIARANRPDLGEMSARADVERARLREVKALRLPWFNDLRVGWQRTIGDGYRDQDEITALLTLNVPLISPWQNKSHRQHEAAIASFEEAREALGQRIDQQVAFGVQAVRAASTGLAEFTREEGRVRAEVKQIKADAATAGDKAGRIILIAEEQLITSSRGRLQALYYYNQAVARLEQALGVPLEEAFAGRSPAK